LMSSWMTMLSPTLRVSISMNSSLNNPVNPVILMT